MGWYDIKDFFTTSDIEKVRNDYKKLVSDLEKQISIYDENVSYINKMNEEPVFIDQGPYNWEGNIITTYRQKQDIIISEREEILRNFKNGRDDAEDSLATARNRLSYLEELCAQEDREKKEKEKGEIDFGD